MPAMPFTIRPVSAAELPALLPQLVELLQQNVDAGASIGFLPPMPAAEAEAYWRSVEEALRNPYRLMLVAVTSDPEIGEQVVGSVQLDLVAKPNAPHRAEVIKLIVAPTARRQGIGRALMQAIEAGARALGRTTLVLDTRQGDPSELLYSSLGYVRVGAIPQYVISENGAMSATVIYYKLI
jgi:ribosomal protein S18 acetylase RimI-like enzyme